MKGFALPARTDAICAKGYVAKAKSDPRCTYCDRYPREHG